MESNKNRTKSKTPVFFSIKISFYSFIQNRISVVGVQFNFVFASSYIFYLLHLTLYLSVFCFVFCFFIMNAFHIFTIKFLGVDNI